MLDYGNSLLGEKKLHWSQKIALVRHNLHAAARAHDFTFFKTLQACAFFNGTDYVGALNNVVDSESDSILATLDNLNAGIAYVYQDAFKRVFDSIKAMAVHNDIDLDSRRASIGVDMSQQKQMADFAIDRMVNSATQLINAQAQAAQDAVANAWIMGTTIISDAMKVCLDEMEALDSRSTDFIRLEYSWSTVQSSVDSAVSALRGIFSLMSNSDAEPGQATRHSSVTSTTSSSSLNMLRRFSNVFAGTGPSHRSPRSSSIASSYASPLQLRTSISAACPTSMPPRSPSYTNVRPNSMSHTTLDPIPPTPAVLDVNPFDVLPEAIPGMDKAAIGGEQGCMPT